MPNRLENLSWESSIVKDYLELFKSFGKAIPPVFWQILKLARVIRTEQIYSEKLNKLWQKATSIGDDKAKESFTVPVISAHDPYLVIRQIKGLDELHMVEPSDMALLSFDELCLAADEGKLMVRDLDKKNIKNYQMQIRSIGVSASKQKCLNFDQKLYLLLDRSYSMKEMHRLLFAKTLLVEYFRLKRGSCAQLFFRGFDYKPSEVFLAENLGDYEKVLKELIFSQPAGKGTDIEAALKTAIHDIKFHAPFREAEILLVTDCLSKIDPQLINKEKENIKIHIVKIGRDEQEPDQLEIKELAKRDHLLEKTDIQRLYSEKLRQPFKEISDLFLELDDIDASLLIPDDSDLDFVRREIEHLKLYTYCDEMQAIELFKRTATLLDFCYLMADGLDAKSQIYSAVKELSQSLEGLMDEFAKKIVSVEPIVDGLMPATKKSRWRRWLAKRSLKTKKQKTKEEVSEFKLSLISDDQFKTVKKKGRMNIFERLLAFIRKLFSQKKI